MGFIVPSLARIYQKQQLTPGIVEFADSSAYSSGILDLMNLTDIASLNLLGGPAGVREALLPRDRLLARFQNPLVTFKKLAGFNMVALPLGMRGIEEVAQWNG